MKTIINIVWMPFRRLTESNLKLLAILALAGVLPSLGFAQDSITVADPSFEQDFNPVWPHYLTALPFGGGWNVSTLAIGNNDTNGPFWDNGAAVDSTYVGFVQNDGLMGQPLSGFQVGETYWIQFFANARIDTDTPDVAVFMSASTLGGGALISGINITPVGGAAGLGNAFKLINVLFTAATNQGDLNILKTAHVSSATNNGSSATLLLDGVSIIRRSANDVVIANPSFEASGTGQTSPGLVNDAVAGWTTTHPGLRINQSSGPLADNGTIPDGGNVLGLVSGAGVSQTLNGLNPGQNYQLSLFLNAHSATANPLAAVRIGGHTAYSGTVAAVGGSNPYTFLTYNFTASATTAILTISNATPMATDTTLLVDNVRVIKQSESIPVANPSFEQGYNPVFPGYLGSIPGWATSSAGLGINDAVSGPFWDNGATVDSTYVAFVQSGGLLGQVNSGFQVGETYWIQFFANARAAEVDTPDITVYESASTAGGAPLVSGLNITSVGAYATQGTGNPFHFINVPFTAAATNGALNIAKSEHSSGGSTLLLDGFSIIRRTPNDIVIANPSFEASGTGQPGVGVVGAVAGWTHFGVNPPIINQAGGPYLDNGTVPDGNNVLILQDSSGYSQILHGLTPGQSYRLTLFLNSRITSEPAPATALVTIDGKTAFNGLVSPVGIGNAFHFISYDFTASAANVTLSFANQFVTNSTLFVDDVRVFAPVHFAPVLNSEPSGKTRYTGGTVTFAASVDGFPTPKLQWKLNASNIAGATNQTLTLTNLQLADAGNYTLYATNSAGSTNTVAAALTVLPVSQYAATVIANSPMGYWRFSDGGGTNAFDYAGDNTAYDPYGLALQAGPRSPAYPGFESTNPAPFLDGSSQGYASAVSLFNNRSNFTLMGWFNIDPSQYPFSFDPFTHPEGRASLFGQEWAAEFGFVEGNLLYFWSMGISQTIYVTNGFEAGQWNFVAAVSDAAANTTTVYLNGAAAGTASACPGATNSYLFSIGKNVAYYPSGGYDNAFFPGSLDEVAAFDHALPASAIQGIYEAGLSFRISLTPQVGGLQVSWPVGHLESATNVTGPWGTVPGAVSPLSVTPNAIRKFYRAVNP